MSVRILHGDCLVLLETLDADSIDSCVTDPPYALGFMGKVWDGDIATRPGTWAAVLRILKPGAHLVVMCGTRTEHRVACAVEDAGFEIRDRLLWLYAQGFPKSHNVSKGIDKKRDDLNDIEAVREWLEHRRQKAGLTRKAVNEALGLADNGGGLMSAWTTNQTTRAVPQWEQWQKLKVLLGFGDEMDAEVWRLNRRKGTPGEAWQNATVIGTREAVDIRNGHGREYGSALFAGSNTGKITLEDKAGNSDAARQWEGWGTALKPAMEIGVLARKPLSEGTVAANVQRWGTGALNIAGCRVGSDGGTKGAGPGPSNGINGILGDGLNGSFGVAVPGLGRWPANVLHDGSEEVLAGFPETTSGTFNGNRNSDKFRNTYGVFKGTPDAEVPFLGSTGSAARFFYCAKAGKEDRAGSKHPTIKPVALMRWLCRLVTPPSGLILDPFAGSGTTGQAAIEEGFRAVLIEREPEYVADIHQRFAKIDKAEAEAMPLFAAPAA